MLKRTCFLMTIMCFFLCGFLIFAQSEAYATSAKVMGTVKAADHAIKKVEILTAQIEKGKELTDKQIAELDNAMEESARLMTEALRETLNVTYKNAKEIEGKEKGKLDLTTLRDYEKSAKGFEARAKKVERQSKVINEKLKKGEIKLDKSALQKLKGKDKEEFKNFLEPKARQQYGKLHPEIFKSEKRAELSHPRMFESLARLWKHPLATISNFIVTPAQAAIGTEAGLPCGGAVAIASGSIVLTGVATYVCLKALADAKIALDKAAAEFNRCNKSCSRWNRWCKAKCWAVYMAKCA